MLGRYDESGRLRYTGRTTSLHAGDASHPWTGRTGRKFRVGWGSRQQLSVHLVMPTVVDEVAVDVARDSAGRWHHPVRPTHIRTDIGPGEVPLFGAAV
ncbi:MULTISPECIES: hypothetical protein [unclassified Streptomyces]|uniref:hypothetical protein n=1 Tax=unclassified Streptomyces TaxID=2593676 RepID=UPI002255BB5D|nr:MULTISPECIES: hypothetical protein [unclassified Streptomyces]MCX5336494.1 hypothetical protein [Streptomyces sp. NBC_00140]MCX5367222.1 hypothetical protein [Streptomyces sp. NBC_00124]